MRIDMMTSFYKKSSTDELRPADKTSAGFNLSVGKAI
jgi:hypothetical protein